ncbi:MAG: ABC transporter permease [Gemmatimonadota bacterium]|jgi:predicted permease
METMWAEFSQAIRTHLRRPLVSVVTSVSIGLGVGVATTLFSVGDALVGREPGVRDPESVARVVRDPSGAAIFSGPELRRLRRATGELVTWVGHQANELVYRIGGAPSSTAWFEIVDPSFFELFVTGAALGRCPRADADREVLLSHGFWSRLGADPDMVGRGVTLNGESFTVAGVAAPAFRGALPGLGVDLWVPMAAQPLLLPRSGSLEAEGDRFLFVTGRMEPGVSLEDVNARLSAVALEGVDGAHGVNSAPHAEAATGLLPRIQRVLGPLVVFMSVMVGLVVFVACANVAGILLSRSAERLPEISIRAALGAGPLRLARVVVLDGIAAGLPGMAVGLALAWVGLAAVRSAPLPAGVPLVLDPRPDGRALVFALLLTAGTALLASLVPAWAVISRFGRGGQGPRLNRLVLALRRWFVGAQVGLATLLVAMSLLLGRGVLRVLTSDPGFRVDGVMTMYASSDLLGYSPEMVQTLWRGTVARARRSPGVKAAGGLLFAPLSGQSDQLALEVPGSDWGTRPVLYNEITDGTLTVLDLEVVRGRGLEAPDMGGEGLPAVLVNETLAGAMGGDAIGRVVHFGHRELQEGLVVGVVEDSHYRSLGEGPTPYLYLPLGTVREGAFMLVAQVEGSMETATSALRGSVTALDPDLVLEFRTLRSAVAESAFFSRVAGIVAGVAGLAGALLALAGLFGTVAYDTTRLRREVAVRRTLGASDRSVRWHLAHRALRIAALGALAGVVAAVALGSVVRGLLHGVPSHDPVTLVVVIALVGGGAAAATWLPSERALRMTPADLLREE